MSERATGSNPASRSRNRQSHARPRLFRPVLAGRLKRRLNCNRMNIAPLCAVCSIFLRKNGRHGNMRGQILVTKNHVRESGHALIAFLTGVHLTGQAAQGYESLKESTQEE